MLESNRFTVSIKHSKSGVPIPVVNNIHLHSVYDPETEAKSFIESNKNIYEKKQNILVLGLGFGYHIQELYLKLTELYQENFEIVVIEPLEEVYTEYYRSTRIRMKNTTYFTKKRTQDLYSNQEFIQFLMKKPGILAHPASFNLHIDYFKSILSYEASSRLTDIASLCKDGNLKSYLLSKKDFLTLDQLSSSYGKKRKITSKFDFLIKAHDIIDNIKTGVL